MTISNETLDIFKKLFDVHQSLKIKAENVETQTDADGNECEVTVLRSKSQNQTMMARVHISEQFPRDVNFYDINEFIRVTKIVKDPVFDFSDNKFVTISSSDGKQKLRYMESNPDLITSYVDKDLPLSQTDIEVVITPQQLNSVLEAAKTMKLKYIGFISDGETMRFSAFEKNNGDNKETNNFSIDLTECEDSFKMYYNLDVHNLSVLVDEGELMFSIDGNRKISKIEAESGKVFWIACDTKSSMD